MTVIILTIVAFLVLIGELLIVQDWLRNQPRTRDTAPDTDDVTRPLVAPLPALPVAASSLRGRPYLALELLDVEPTEAATAIALEQERLTMIRRVDETRDREFEQSLTIQPLLDRWDAGLADWRQKWAIA